jgi:radical SAM superfamily enzyme YgiQ (UPF0313 family)
MRVLLVSTYELGHQPLNLAAPAAALSAAGHDVRTLDTSVEPWNPALVTWADAVAFSVPMHTAMRLALRGAAAVRAARPDLPVCLYGLYAAVSGDVTLGPAGVADHAIAGEYEPELVAWVGGLAAGSPAPTGAGRSRAVVDLGRHRPPAPPERAGLPPLRRYARLALGGEERTAGYVEASRGCVHRCRHCPIPVVYDGRLRIVPEDVVLADVEAQVEAGARHITFGDPDFLNGPHHSLRVVAAVHKHWPELTFDCTTKVEHILRHADLWPELAEAGCLFVVSAFESVNDDILAVLDKGHTTAEAAAAVGLLRRHGIEIRPSFLPFTPWTTAADVADLLDFVAALDLVANVDPVQYTIRLLVPEGSLLEPILEREGRLGPYDAGRLSWTWHNPDPAVDTLQSELAGLVERAQAGGEPIGRIYEQVRDLVYTAAGRARAAAPVLHDIAGDRPRLTEPWFCCAEPTEGQFTGLGDCSCA